MKGVFGLSAKSALSSSKSDGGPGISWSRRFARADSSVALITAAGEIVVGGCESDVFERLTIFGAPRTTVRPSSSSCDSSSNRCDEAGGGRLAGGGRMLTGGGRTLAGREREGDGGGTVAGRPAAGSGREGTTLIDFDGMMFVISSSPMESAGGRIADDGGELRFTCEIGVPPSLDGV